MRDYDLHWYERKKKNERLEQVLYNGRKKRRTSQEALYEKQKKNELKTTKS